MDSISLIGMASIISAGLTIGIGAIGPALGEGRAVAQGLASIAQQPDETNSITRTLFVGLAMIESTAIYCFVVSMILIFANPFWDHVIQARLEEAKNRRKEAEDEAESHRRKNEELEERREQMLGEAREEADLKLKEMTREARKEVEGARRRWQESLEKGKSAFLQDLKQLAAREVYVLTRKALKDLADADLEERLVDVFVSKLKELKKEDKDAVKKAIQEEDNKALVRSGFELSTGSRQKITRAVRDEIAEHADIAYDTEPQVIMGLELKARGEKVVWTVRDYLAELEERAKSAVEKEIHKGGGSKRSSEEETIDGSYGDGYA